MAISENESIPTKTTRLVIRGVETIRSEPYKYIHHMYLLYYIILIYSHYVVVSISFFFLCSRKIPILTIFQFC